MSADELLLLGLLDERSRHGYELHEFLGHRLPFISDLKKSTAYRLLERLHSQGLVAREVAREGRRPERLVYHLTDAGRDCLDRMLREQLAAADDVRYPGNVALLFADRLSPSERAALLAQRRSRVSERRARIAAFADAHAAGTLAHRVLEHDLAHAEAELAWLDRTIASLAVELSAS